MEPFKSDYLKYYPVIKKYVKDNYKITESQLSMMLFLYSEMYFSKGKFDEFDELFGWDQNRFGNLLRDGWIHVFRKGNGKKFSTLYCLSFKAKNLVALVYGMLNGERIPTTALQNKMFKVNVGYSTKVTRELIKKMNAYYRERRRALNPGFYQSRSKQSSVHLSPE